GPSGKLDRDALPPAIAGEQPSARIVTPRTPTERLLADIWCRVLSLDEVGVTHNFFELGGDSIQSIQLVSRAVQAGQRLTPQDVFLSPTIERLAAIAD